MMTLAWKEVRENLRWALLAMVVLGAAEGFALWQSQSEYTVGYNYGKSLGLCESTFLTVTTFGCAIVGVLLGLVQILPELRRDQWASLLHRPVSRGTIFRGKVAGGVLLYALATVPPFLFSLWLEAAPGHFALPFVPETALAGTADICAGVPYYFAALAMALQRGKWIGWRLFPFAAALHTSYYVLSTELFRAAVVGTVLMSLVLFTAAWGIALHQDGLGARPWLARGAYLAMAFYSACGLGDMGRSVFDVIGPARKSHYVEHMLTDAGTPLRITYDDNVVTSVRDLAGQIPADSRYQPGQIRNHLMYSNGFSSFIGDPHGWHRQLYRREYRDSFRYFSLVRAYYYPRPEQWFYLERQRSWVGYLALKKVALGRLDQNGFEPLAATSVPFDAQSLYNEVGDKLVLYNRSSVRLALLPARQIVDIALPGPGPVFGVGTAFANTGNGSITYFGVTLAREMAVFDEKGAAVATLPYRHDVDRWGRLLLAVSAKADRFYLQYDPSLWLPWETIEHMPSYLDELDANGQVLKAYTLPPLPPYYQSTSWSDWVADRVESPAFFFGSMVYQRIGALIGFKRLAHALADRFGRDRHRTQELALVVACLSLTLAAITLVWTRRLGYSWRRSWAWTLFVLVFGLGGFIAFRLASDWPQWVPCPSCGQRRLITAETCPHCQTAWPAHPADGTEIFDRDPEEGIVVTAAS